jgi:hypothetical protein
MHELTGSFAWRTAQALTETSLGLAYSGFDDIGRQAADRARKVMAIEAGPSGSSYSAAERLMLFEGDLRWLVSALYDDNGACRVPLERISPSNRLPGVHDLLHLASEVGGAERDLMDSKRARPDEVAALRYIARRLELVDSQATRAAAQKVHAVLTRHEDSVWKNLDDGFYDSIWADVTRSVDRGDFAPEHRDLLSALEMELAGHVLGLRLTEGKLIRSEFAETQPPEQRGFLRRVFAR